MEGGHERSRDGVTDAHAYTRAHTHTHRHMWTQADREQQH